MHSVSRDLPRETMTPPPSPARTEQQWLELVRAQILRGDSVSTGVALAHALQAFPQSFELRRILANSHRQARRLPDAEALLRELLRENPGDVGSAFALAQLLVGQARTAAAAHVIRAFFEVSPRDPEAAIKAIELLDEIDRKGDAAVIAEQAIVAAPDDVRLHAYAGMLQLQIGDFDLARRRYLYVMQYGAQACEWDAPLGLANAQRYGDSTHPDFALLHACLQRQDLTSKARSGLLFSLGKAHDDIGDYPQAADYFRQANALAHGMTRWSRKDWRRAVEARLSAPAIAHPLAGRDDFIPVFIVGMPRSGTTLLAELLARRPEVCNRGEMPWIARSAQQPDLAGIPEYQALERHSKNYRVQTVRDDAGDARWFIDKQPLNFRYVDLILAMFPNARIIHCLRDPSDTALSLWMQSFKEEVQGYAYDFDDIALVTRDCGRLMEHWRERFPDSIRTVRYEELITATHANIHALAAWIGLPANIPPSTAAPEKPVSVISTASLWQARQPISTRSIGRWKYYAPYIPELPGFSA